MFREMFFLAFFFLGMLWVTQASQGLKPPGYLVGYVTGDTSVKLAWEVTSPSNKTVFEIRWKNGRNESSMVVSGTTGTVTIHDLRVYTKYFFRVRKGFMNGTWGGFTKYRHIWTPEGVPTAPPANVTAYNTSSVGIIVFWEQIPRPHRHGNVIGFKVCYKRADKNDSVLYCTAVFALGIELGGLRSYTPYWITVLGFTNKGDGPSSLPLLVWTDEFVPSVAPRITSLTANYTAIRVAWAPIPQEHVKGILRGYYIIYWKMPRVSHDNSIIQVNQSTLSVVIVGLEQNTTYGVRLTGFTRIRGWIRNGVLGRVHNITTKHVPEAPQNVNVFSPCSTCLTVTWDPVYTSPTDTLTAYRVVYKDASGKAYRKKIGSRKSIAQLTSLEKFSTYTVTVTAVTDEGLGETSSSVIVTTLEDVPSRAPDSLQARSTGTRSILIEWSPVPKTYVHGNLRGYHVYYRTGRSKVKRSTSHVGALSVNTSGQSLEIKALEPFTSYDVWVSAFTIIGSGPSSTPVTVTTDEDVPSPPRRISVKKKEKSRLVLQWRKPEETNGIIKKYVLHLINSDGDTKTYTLNSDVDKEYVTYEVTLPDIETEYKIKVQAFNSLPGQMSDEITVQHSPNIQTSEGRKPNNFKFKFIWLVAGLAAVVLLLVLVTIFVLVRRESRRSKNHAEIHKRTLSIISQSARPRRPVPVKDLVEHCARFHDNNNALFDDEFRCLDLLTWKSTWEASQDSHNRSKNRYCNIVAYDHSRVVLTGKREIPGSDYINANYVDGYSFPAKYIAAQDRQNIVRVAVIPFSCIVFVLLVVIGVLIWRIRRAEPNNRTTTANKTTDDIGRPKSPRAQHVSEPGVYMELHPRPTDGQSHAPVEYQTLQGRHMTSGFYNVGFKAGRKKKEDEEVYDEVGSGQC